MLVSLHCQDFSFVKDFSWQQSHTPCQMGCTCEVRFIREDAPGEGHWGYTDPHPLAIQGGDPNALGKRAVLVLLR